MRLDTDIEHLRRLIDRLSPAIDPHCGIIRAVLPMQLAPEVSGLFHGSAAPLGRQNALRPKEISLLDDGPVVGYGTSVMQELGEVRAICEALERYCSLMPPTVKARLRATARELDNDALDIFTLPLCSESERAAAPRNLSLAVPAPTHAIEWVPGISLTRNREIWVPLTCVYLGLPLPLNEYLSFPISTGFAAGEDYTQAISAGLLEVVERDSLAIWWLAQSPFPRLGSPFTDEPTLARLLSALAKRGLETYLFDLTTDVGLPVIGLVQLAVQTFPHVVTMAACRASAQEAALRVIEEAASLRTALIASRRVGDEFSDLLSGAPVAAERFGLYHAGVNGIGRFRRIIATAPEVGTAADIAGEELIASVVARLGAMGHEVVVVDVTAPEVRDRGIVVVRVIVPGLMPLTFSHAIRFLAHPRLQAAIKRFETTVCEEPIPFA
jgi:ribosomal protein S12 methylthiotransferase accessory factor